MIEEPCFHTSIHSQLKPLRSTKLWSVRGLKYLVRIKAILYTQWGWGRGPKGQAIRLLGIHAQSVNAQSELITGRPLTTTGTRSPNLQLIQQSFLLSALSIPPEHWAGGKPLLALYCFWHAVCNKQDALSTSYAPDLPNSDFLTRQHQYPGLFTNLNGLFCDHSLALAPFSLWPLSFCLQNGTP